MILKDRRKEECAQSNSSYGSSSKFVNGIIVPSRSFKRNTAQRVRAFLDNLEPYTTLTVGVMVLNNAASGHLSNTVTFTTLEDGMLNAI